jgi:protein-S-isoprenylcysteine O-methyltransferase Ste14
MNDSITNFVLTKVNSDEALEMELISRKKGTWNTAFAVILLLIVSLVIFLSIGQQNFLNDLNAFLTAIVALVGLLIRFSGFLSFGGSKTIDA